MTRILANALRPLGGLFGVAGSQVSTEDIDLSSVQLVADVVRLAGVGRGQGIHEGRTTYWASHTYTVSALTEDDIPVYAPAADAQPPWPAAIPAEYDVWVLHCGAELSGTGMAQLDFATVSLLIPASYIGATPDTPAATMIPLWGAEDPIGSGIDSSGQAAKTLFQSQMPVWCPRGSSLRFNSRSAGAGNFTVRISATVVSMPKGCTPP